jgi:hypothetical protein
VTDILDRTYFNINNLRKVTDNRNDKEVKVTVPRWIFPDYSHNQIFEPEFSKKLNLWEILESLALCFDSKRYWLMASDFERFIANQLDLQLWELNFDMDLYETHFAAINLSDLSMFLCWDDVLYVYDDSRIFIAKSELAKQKFRKLRGIE